MESSGGALNLTQHVGTNGIHDSIIKILLSATYLQQAITDSVLELIPSLHEEAQHKQSHHHQITNSSTGTVAIDKSTNLPKLILTQFRWIDFAMDHLHLTNKLLELLEVCANPNVKRDIISLLPEILHADSKSIVVSKLLALMSDDLAMTTAVLEALGNISLDLDETDVIVKRMRAFLPSAQIGDLPVVLRFLLQASDGENIILTLESMRSNITFESNIPPDKAIEPLVRKTDIACPYVSHTINLFKKHNVLDTFGIHVRSWKQFTLGCNSGIMSLESFYLVLIRHQKQR